MKKKPIPNFLEGIAYELGVTLGACYYEKFLKDMPFFARDNFTATTTPTVTHQRSPDSPRHNGPLEGCSVCTRYESLTQSDINALEDTVRATSVNYMREDGLYAVHHGDPTPVPECLKDILPTNCSLPTEDSEEDDHWFLSSDRQPASPEMIKSMEKTTEAARAESEMMRAQDDLERQRRAQISERWNSPRIDHMVSTYGEIEAFTGLTDLTEEQVSHLKVILNSAPLNVMKKNKRAAELVKKWITPEEWAQLLKEHKVTIKSKKYKNRQYDVFEVPHAQVVVYEKGIIKMKICGVDADSSYAEGDQVLNKIISIKEDEDYYIKNSAISRY